jgi:AcrR family transcriptional regulator
LRGTHLFGYGRGVDERAAPGLRERKKQETREALSWAALRLSVERGPDAVLVEDIAAEAGVSPRTFNNYFSSKAEAIAFRHLDRVRLVADALRTRPAEEPLWDAVTGAVLDVFGRGAASPDIRWVEGVRLVVAQPTLQGEFLKAGATGERLVAEVIAARTGTDVHRDLYPRLVAATIGAVVSTATTQWLVADPPVPIGALFRDALALVAAGFPEPHAE